MDWLLTSASVLPTVEAFKLWYAVLIFSVPAIFHQLSGCVWLLYRRAHVQIMHAAVVNSQRRN
jgi:hypothetical protein